MTKREILFIWALCAVVGAVLGLLFWANKADAAMPNYVGTDYKQVAQCVSGDLYVYEMVGSDIAPTGCISADAWLRETLAARERQNDGIRFPAGTSVTLKSGKTEYCPWYYVLTGCVISQSLVK